MRRLFLAAAAAVTLTGAGLLAGGSAEAMQMAGGLTTGPAAEPVALVCNRVWNGYAWVRRCYETAPRYYRPRYYAPRYYAPRRYYY